MAIITYVNSKSINFNRLHVRIRKYSFAKLIYWWIFMGVEFIFVLDKWMKQAANVGGSCQFNVIMIPCDTERNSIFQGQKHGINIVVNNCLDLIICSYVHGTKYTLISCEQQGWEHAVSSRKTWEKQLIKEVLSFNETYQMVLFVVSWVKMEVEMETFRLSWEKKKAFF